MKFRQTLVIVGIIMASVCFAPDFEMHLLVGKYVQKVVPDLNTGLYVVDKLPKWGAMMASHRLADYGIGEGYIGKSHYASTAVGTMIMFYLTPDEKKGEFVENFIFTCLIPDILFKKYFHGEEDHLYEMTGEQTGLADKFSMLIYAWEVQL